MKTQSFKRAIMSFLIITACVISLFYIKLVVVSFGASSIDMPTGNDIHLFRYLDAINYQESLGFVFLMLILLLFSSEIVKLICRKSDIFEGCDFIEKLTYRCLIGVSIIILSLESTYIIGPFLKEFSWGITIIGSMVFLITHKNNLFYAYNKLRGGIGNIRRARLWWVIIRTVIVYRLSVFTIILIGFFLVSASTVIHGYYGSTNFDGALHTLFINSYIDMNQVTERCQPYDFIIRYPRGSFIIGAYATEILQVPVHKIVSLMTLLLFFLNLTALYTLGKTFFRGKAMGALVLIFGSYSQNMLSPVSWGGLPFIMGLFTTAAGLSFTSRFLEKGNIMKDSLLLALVLYVVFFSYPTSSFFVFSWFFLCFITRIIYLMRRRVSKAQIRRSILLVSLAVILATGLSSTFFLTMNNELHSWMTNPNQGSFPEIIPPKSQWYLDNLRFFVEASQFNPFNPVDFFNYSQFHGHVYAFAYMTPFLTILFFLEKRKENNETLPFCLRILLLYLLFLFAVIYLRSLVNVRMVWDFPLGDLIDPIRIFQSLFILLSLLSVAVIWMLSRTLLTYSPKRIKICKNGNRWSISLYVQRKLPSRKTIIVSFIVITTIFYMGTSTGNNLFDISEPIGFVAENRKTFGHFNRLSPSDIVLMLWMRYNLPRDSVVFINWQDGGQYMSVVAGLKAIYAVSPLYDTRRYRQMVETLAYNPFDRTVVELIVNYYNASYVFIGARGSEPRWDATVIGLSPYFELIQRYDSSFLFRIKLD